MATKRAAKSAAKSSPARKKVVARRPVKATRPARTARPKKAAGKGKKGPAALTKLMKKQLNETWIKVAAALGISVAGICLVVFTPKKAVVESRDTASVPTTVTTAVKVAPTTDPLTARFNELAKVTLAERIAFWSEEIIKPNGLLKQVSNFKAAPANTDSAPWIPTRFNCTTYVETVVALSKSMTPGDFYTQLAAIRYKGAKTGFATRNHFPEADWIPNGTQAGVLVDGTKTVAQTMGVTFKQESKTIHRGEWLEQQLKTGLDRKIASVVDPAWKAPVKVTLPYVSLTDVSSHVATIPSGTIANLVHPNNPKRPVLISHQGFILQKSDGTYFRHSSVKGVIRTVLLKDYLQELSEESKRWPVVGFNLNSVQGT